MTEELQPTEDAQVCRISRWQLLKRELNNLCPEDFKQALEEDEDAVLLDVRRPTEYAEHHLPNALNIDYLAYDFWDRMEQLDMEKTYYVYCRSGRRSLRACTLMKNGGFANVLHLDGGLNKWKEVFE